MNNASDTSNLIVKTKDKEFIFKFDESSYSVRNDTIYGKGKYILKENVEESFLGGIDIKDVEEIQIDKFNLFTTLLLGYLVVSVVAVVVVIFTQPYPIFDN